MTAIKLYPCACGARSPIEHPPTGCPGPVVNGERFAPGYDERTALYEQHTRLDCRPDCKEEHYQLALGL